MRKIVSDTIHYSARYGRKMIGRNPRLKNAIKRVLVGQLSFLGSKPDVYRQWVNENMPDFISIPRLQRRAKELKYRPLISIIVPTYNTPEGFLRDCLDSVIGQVYDNWELCIADDASPDEKVRELIKEYAKQDSRIKYIFLDKNQQIAGATNAAVELATGEYVSLFDHDDLLWPNALLEIVEALNKDSKLDFIYTDEDKITENRHEHLGAFFKPDWNPDFLHSVNYITHFSTIRTSLLRELGGLNGKYNGAQDWDLFLRVTSVTDKIHHIPKVVYSWRIHSESTAKSTDAKPYVVNAQRMAIQDDLARKGDSDASVEQDPEHKGYWRVQYPVRNNPKVSIVIPSKNLYSVVKRCLISIYEKSTYDNFEVILVDTGSDDKRCWSLYNQFASKHDNFKLVKWPEKPFSYARSCNEGARQSSGDILIMLNNDTEVITPDWIEVMVSEAQRETVGAVGCLLFYPDKYHIQHAGVGVGLGGVAANSFQMMTLEQPMSQTQHIYINTRHNLTAVTAACLAIRKTVYDEIGGFDEEFRVTYNDVDLCLRLYEKGYQNLYTPYARLLHHESISVGSPEEVAKRDTAEFRAAKELFIKRWKKFVEHDPNINPQLFKGDAFYDVRPITKVGNENKDK